MFLTLFVSFCPLPLGTDVNLIGQFGVGFYSAFLVADKVTVISKSYSDPTQHIWESTADASFKVAPDPRGNTLGRGTTVILHLKDDSTEFLDTEKIKAASTKFNQFVNFPIMLHVTKEVEEEVPEEPSADDEDVKATDADEEKDKEKKPKTKKVKKTVHEWEHINKLKPIWMRPKEDITPTEYHEFYKSIAKDYSDPLAYIHFSAEGEVDFKVCGAKKRV